MIFCYNLELLQSFGIFVLQNTEVDLYTDILKLAFSWLKNRGRLIHRFDLYTGKYGSYSLICAKNLAQYIPRFDIYWCE